MLLLYLARHITDDIVAFIVAEGVGCRSETHDNNSKRTVDHALRRNASKPR
ncbi:hypothetical protein O9992_03070 [Vibrio lentus]|nr:hypothetical protein [Vibrio lentus]